MWHASAGSKALAFYPVRVAENFRPTSSDVTSAYAGSIFHQSLVYLAFISDAVDAASAHNL
jgi:hypothetical protein